MRVAFCSDYHIDHNIIKHHQYNILETLCEELVKEKVDIVCFAGDMTANMQQTIEKLKFIQKETGVIVKAIPGNHDLYSESAESAWDLYNTFKEQEFSLLDNPYELNNEWVIIGDMGWYDYSFADPCVTIEELESMQLGRIVWWDKYYCHWKGTKNQELAKIFNQKIEEQLEKNKHKNIILITHVVPFEKYVLKKDRLDWDFLNAYIGSSELGTLIDKYQVKIANFGHTHKRYIDNHNGTKIICTPLGYFPEWKNKNVSKEVKKSLVIIDI
jgi:putative phosphoesterase